MVRLCFVVFVSVSVCLCVVCVFCVCVFVEERRRGGEKEVMVMRYQRRALPLLIRPCGQE